MGGKGEEGGEPSGEQGGAREARGEKIRPRRAFGEEGRTVAVQQPDRELGLGLRGAFKEAMWY